MKRLMSKKNLLGAAGLSLVELIVSMAILAVVGVAIGGAMYVTSRSYTRNSAEINVQEEAQVASNLICDWLVDAQEVTPDGAGNPAGATSTSLEIKHWENGNLVTVNIFRAGSDLKYTAKNDAGAVIGEGVLASNVTGVTFTSKFKETRNVQIALDFDVNERTYHSVTDSTSRNHDFIADAAGANNARPIITFDIPPTRGSSEFEVFLEPGQNDSQHASFTFNATVYNYDPSNTTFTVTDSTGHVHDVTCTFVDNGTNVFPVTCTTADHAKLEGQFTFTATKTVTDPVNGTVSTLIDQKLLDVRIRRATECAFKDAPSSSASDVEELFEADVVVGTHGAGGCQYEPVYVYLGSQTYPRVPGAAYDSVFVDSSKVKFEYRFSDGTDASSYIDHDKTVEITTGQPSVQVVLKETLPAGKDLFVVAVSTHQGDMTGNAGNYNVSATGENKLRLAPYNVDGWDYYDGVQKGVTWDVFKIKSTVSVTPPPFTFGEHGISRGTPSFELGHMNPAFRTWLYNYLTNPPSSGGLGKDVNTVRSGFEYYTSMRFKEKGTSTWSSPYVINKTNNWDTTNQHIFTQGYTDDRGYESFLFELTKSYDVEITFSVYDNNHNFIYSTSASSYVPAAQANIYNPNDSYGRFLTDTYKYDVTNNTGNYYSYHYTNNGGTVDSFFIYFDSVNMNNNTGNARVSYKVQRYNTTTHNWDDVSADFNGKIQMGWKEGEFLPGNNRVRLSDGTATGFDQYICKGYQENDYPDYGVNLEVLELHGDCPFVTGYTYRISFETYYPHAEGTAITNGILGGASGCEGKVASYNMNHYYHVSNESDNTGFIYIKGDKPA